MGSVTAFVRLCLSPCFLFAALQAVGKLRSNEGGSNNSTVRVFPAFQWRVFQLQKDEGCFFFFNILHVYLFCVTLWCWGEPKKQNHISGPNCTLLWSPTVLRALEYRLLMIAQTLAHVLYFSWLLLPSVESLQSHVQGRPASCRKGWGEAWGVRGGQTGCSPDGGPLIIPTALKTVFWIDCLQVKQSARHYCHFKMIDLQSENLFISQLTDIHFSYVLWRTMNW